MCLSPPGTNPQALLVELINFSGTILLRPLSSAHLMRSCVMQVDFFDYQAAGESIADVTARVQGLLGHHAQAQAVSFITIHASLLYVICQPDQIYPQ